MCAANTVVVPFEERKTAEGKEERGGRIGKVGRSGGVDGKEKEGWNKKMG